MSSRSLRSINSRFLVLHLKPALLTLGGFFYVVLGGCASAPQTQQVLAGSFIQDSPRIELHQTPFNPQLDYQCGPASLATLLQYNDLDIRPEQLAPKVFLPGKKGSLQVELIAATRRLGMHPYVIENNIQTLLREVQAGRPVLVLQNLGLSWSPQWHYAVVIGYDLQQQVIVLRSGKDKRRLTDLSVFERTWSRSGYWGMVVVLFTEIPITATPHRYLASAVAFEKLQQWRHAIQAYQSGITRWPGNKPLHMALGNVYYQSGEIDNAEQQFRHLLQQDSKYAPAMNNLAQILLKKNQLDEALHWARLAVNHAGRFKQHYQKTLDAIELRRRGGE